MAPARVDQSGRLFEIEVALALDASAGNVARCEELRGKIGPDRSASIARSASALAQIILLDHPGISHVRIVGEERKGVDDADLEIDCTAGRVYISVKHGAQLRANVWNPTFESFFKHLTGKRFREHLSPGELVLYDADMTAIQTSDRSDDISLKWVSHGASVLRDVINSPDVRDRLREKVAKRSEFLYAAITQKNGEIIVLRGSDTSLGLLAKTQPLTITANGVSLRVRASDTDIVDFACYRNSGSGGIGKGLRIAAWTILLPAPAH